MAYYVRYGRQATQFYFLGGVIHVYADIALEIELRIRLMWACLRRFDPGSYDKKWPRLI